MADEAVSRVVVEGDTSGAQGSIKNLGLSFGGLFGTIVGGVASGNLLANAISGVIKTFKGMVGGAIQMNASLQTTTLQFGTLMKDSTRAEEHVKSLFEFAKKTPFETGPIIEASKHLQVFGGNALNTKANLTLLGNASAATNAPIDKLGFWVGRLYSQLQAGKPFGESAMRLQELAVLTPKARNEMEALKIAGGSATDVFAIFQKEMGNFDGAMIKQAGTWAGLTSSITDSVNMMLADVFKPFFTVASEGLESLVALMGTEGFESAVQAAADAAESSLRAVLDWMKTDGKAAAVETWELVKALYELGEVTFNEVKKEVGGLFQELKNLFTSLPQWMQDFAGAQFSLTSVIRSTVKEIKMMTEVVSIFRDVVNNPGTFDWKKLTKYHENVETVTAGLKGLIPEVNKVRSAEEALALVRETEAKATANQAAGVKTLTSAQKEQKKALDDINAAMKPLTATQQAQILQWQKLGEDSIPKMAKALGVADGAVEKFVKNLAASKKEIPTQEIDDLAKALLSNQGIAAGARQAAIDIKNLGVALGVAKENVVDFRSVDLSQLFSHLKTPEITTAYKQSPLNSFFTNDLGKLITSSFAGGGNVMKTIASGLGGAVFAPEGGLAKTLTKGVTGIFGSGGGMLGTIGKSVASLIPGLGALIGPALQGLTKLFSGMFGTAGRDAVREFAAGLGGFDTLHAKLLEMGAAGEQLWIKLTQGVGRNDKDAAKAAIQEVNAALEEHRLKIEAAKAAQAAFVTTNQAIIDKFNEIKVITPEIQTAIDAALSADTPDAFAAAMANITGVLDEQSAKQKELDAVMKEYGISWTKAGQAAKEAKVAEISTDIKRKFDLLIGAGVGVVDVMKGMGPQVNDFVKQARQAGVQVPESFKAVIEAAIAQGKVFDDNGKKITDITQTGLTFGKSTAEEFMNVGTQIEKLTAVLERLAGGFTQTVTTAGQAGAAIVSSMKSAQKYIEDTSDSLDELNFGSSPGGLKEIPILGERARRAFMALRDTGVSEIQRLKREVDSLGFGRATAMTANLNMPDVARSPGAVSGGGAHHVELISKVYLQDREIARAIVPVLPSVLKELGLA